MSSLEASITLEDVFNVVEGKRVPLAPELAGYLTLEIADGADAGGGDVDPKTVFISDEGTVALVRPKNDAATGDAEASVRRLLVKLLEASGSGTPALGTAAKRKPGNGLPALVEELEAALIPVNRSAGRRALARLAREVKRVLLGVGRNASVAPVVNRQLSAPPHARPPIRKRSGSFESTEAPTARRPDLSPDVILGDVSPRESAPKAAEVEVAPAIAAALPLPAPPPIEPPKASPAPPPAIPPSEPKVNASPRPPAVAKEPTPAPPVVKDPTPRAPEVSTKAPPVALSFAGDEVDSLLDSFGVSSSQGEKQMSRELKAIAGLSPTPPPPDAKTLAELTKDIGGALPRRLETPMDGDSVEALLAMTDASAPIRVQEEPATPRMPVRDFPPSMPPLPPSTPALPKPVPTQAKEELPERPADDRALGEKNLPPSPLFGVPVASRSQPGSLPGAPAALRKAEASEPKLPRDDGLKADPTRAAASTPSVRGGKSTDLRGTSAPTSTTRKTKPRRRAPRMGMLIVVLTLVVLGGATVATWKIAPQVFTGRRHLLPTATVAPTAPTPPPPKCKVALVLTDVPANAEILLRMGQAPVDVERMPVGTRLELVATAEGHAPRRAIIKAESQWDKGPDGKPRIEVPIQLDPSKAKPGAVDPWPVAEPGSQVGGSGPPGLVHVVSNVRGAEVWLLAGLGPEARIDQLKCDGDIDVLLAGPPALRKRLHVLEKDIAAATADATGSKVVNVSGK